MKLRSNLMIHQFECIDYARTHSNFILGDKPGLGKTIQSIACALDRRDKYGIKRCLIICGVNGLQYNWEEEIRKHSFESARILGNRLGKRTKIWGIKGSKEKLEDLNNLGDEFFLITNVEVLRNRDIKNKLRDLCISGEIGMCVVDEFHLCIKSPSSQQGKGIHALNPNYKLLLSGTPLMNSPLDLYNPLKWIGVEKHNFFQFKNFYCVLGGFGGHEIVGYKHLDVLQNDLDGCMLRRENAIDLPDKIIIKEYIDMLPDQSKLYKEVRKGIVDNIDKIVLLPNPLVELARLRQVTGCPELISSTITRSAKLERMKEIVSDLVSNGEQVVVFSCFSKIITAAHTLIADVGVCKRIVGEVDTTTRQKYVEEFQRGEIDVLLGTKGAMGTGLTLTKGTSIIFIDSPWTKADKDQCEARCWRIGTTDHVKVYNLLCRHTVDEKIYDLVEFKGELSDALVDKTITGRDLVKEFRQLLY